MTAGLLAWFAIRLLKHHSAVENGLDVINTQPFGVGGFLDLIIFWKAAIAPMLAVCSMTNQLIAPEESTHFVLTNGWSDYKFYFALVTIAIQLANWWVVYQLAFRFTASSARNAKILFFVTPFVPVLQYFIAKYYLDFSSSINVLLEFGGSFALSMLFFSYFTLSAQIKELYYSPLDKNGQKLKTKQSEISLVTGNKKLKTNGGAEIFALKKNDSHFHDFRKCPYCAEEIKSDAIKCRYCLSELNTTEA